jgi:hypothetical protein
MIPEAARNMPPSEAEVADRLLNVACAMLKTGTTFNPSLATEKSP